MLGIVNYGVGNLQNIQNAINFLGKKSIIVNTPEQLSKVSKIILPGVGSFSFCVKKIREFNFYQALIQKAKSGTPMLGICVGMQVLFDKGEEGEIKQGLGIIAGTVKKIKSKYKVPHIGWNKVTYTSGDKKTAWFYFVHSYHCIPEDESKILAYCSYGLPIASVVKDGNVFGCQFHPEKSQKDGINFLNQFIKI